MYQLDQKEIDSITNYIFLEDALETADAIFIPGCARPEHTEEAARLYQQGLAPIIIPSGGYTKLEGGFQGVKVGSEKYGSEFSCEADFLEAVLLKNGVPQSAVLKEQQATYTLENAEKTKELIEQKHLDIRTAILCCKSYHARRAHLYYHMVMPDIRLLVHPVEVDSINKKNWYTTKRGREIVLGELSRMGEQLLMMEGRIQY